MKRILATLGVTAAFLAVPTAASADFHFTYQACATQIGVAGVTLTASGTNLTYKGSVTCSGATYVNITSLQFKNVVTGATDSAPTATCSSCTATPTTTSGVELAQNPGLYDVTMHFSAKGPGGIYNPIRNSGYYWTGQGQPTAYCTQTACHL